MLSESSTALLQQKLHLCNKHFVDELSVDMIEDDCQILQWLKDFMLLLTCKFHKDNDSLKVANIFNCSQYVSSFFFFFKDFK